MNICCQFWKVDEALLLYSGDLAGNIFKKLKTEDYYFLKKNMKKLSVSVKWAKYQFSMMWVNFEITREKRYLV
ncbi:hypothetical protein N9D46_00885 [Chitinophagales bacterium]|nr:hypothetical protein [Chitinophagales bacterium]